MNITISGDAVAWYGAIVATLSVFVGGYAVWRDRAKLKVTARPGMKLSESVGDYSADTTYIVIEVANVGRRAIHLRQLPFFKLKGKKTEGLIVKGPWQPKEHLEEGQSASMLCKQDNMDLSMISRVVVKDATGRKWKGKIEKGGS
jgi:hypothetical protein